MDIVVNSEVQKCNTEVFHIAYHKKCLSDVRNIPRPPLLLNRNKTPISLLPEIIEKLQGLPSTYSTDN